MKEKEGAEATSDPMAKRVSSHPFVRGLSPRQLALLSDCALPARFAPGEMIFRQGEQASRFYLITKGEVVLEAQADGGEPVALETVGAGDFLGWSWMMPPYRWHFTARAAAPTEAVFFVSQILRQYCERDHSLGQELHQRMSAVMMKRLQAVRQKVLSLWAQGLHWEAVLESPFIDQELDAGCYADPAEPEDVAVATKSAGVK